MKIVNVVENGELLYQVYRRYTEKIFEKIKDPYVKTLILISYKTNDLMELLNFLKKYNNLYFNALSKGDFLEAFLLYSVLKRIYSEYESKVIERIINMVKLYAFYLLKNKN